jgi:membrane fusion protein (multidrug efflux system)
LIEERPAVDFDVAQPTSYRNWQESLQTGEPMTRTNTFEDQAPGAAPAANSGLCGTWRKLRIARTLGWTTIGIVVALPIVAGIAAIKAHQFKEMGEAAARLVPPPRPVNVAEVREMSWQPRLSAVGSVVAVQGTEVSAEAEGVVREIRFDAGSTVPAGAELVQLDVEVEEAELRAAQAAAELAQVSFHRSKELVATRSTSQAEFDEAATALKQANARVDNLRALIAKKTIRAPFGGKLGIRRISVGQFLTKGSPVVSLQSLDPVYVEFSLPQQELAGFTEGLKVLVSSDAYPGRRFDGEITAVNPSIDPATRNFRAQATLKNPEHHLRPGMFVSVEVILPQSEELLLIPATAVVHGPFGDSVFLIQEGPPGPDGAASLVAEQRFVRLGDRHGDYVAARSGLKAGEKLISTGGFKLRPGMPVVIDNTLAPQFALAPNPQNH